MSYPNIENNYRHISNDKTYYKAYSKALVFEQRNIILVDYLILFL